MFCRPAVLDTSCRRVQHSSRVTGASRLSQRKPSLCLDRRSFRRYASDGQTNDKADDALTEGTPRTKKPNKKPLDQGVSDSTPKADTQPISQSPAEDPVVKINPEPVIEAVEVATETIAESVVGAAVQVSKAVTSEADVASSTDDQHSTASSPEPETSDAEPATSDADLGALKLQLLAAVSSLDRGIAANVREAREVDDVAKKLEAAGGRVTLEWKTQPSSPDTATMEVLSGTWRLIYSSGFNTGGLGGTRPGPPAAFVPLVLGQVYQRIDSTQAKLDNIVEFLFSYGLPPLPFLSSEPESPAARLTLGHDFTVLGSNTVEITYEDTSAELLGTQFFDSLPKFEVPQVPDFLKPPKFVRSATFDVTFLDEEMRVTRGDRGELRIYLKDEDLGAAVAPADYED